MRMQWGKFCSAIAACLNACGVANPDRSTIGSDAVKVPDNLLLVGGLPKCGTSHLHGVLASHSNVLALQKEIIPLPAKDSTFEAFIFFFAGEIANVNHTDLDQVREACYKSSVGKRLLENGTRGECDRLLGFNSTYSVYVPQRPTELRRPKLLVVTCIRFLEFPELVRRWGASVRAIFMVRDPADYLWAAFNFWTFELDPQPVGVWTRMGTDYRTPELFHELLLADGRIGEWWIGKDKHSGAWFSEIANGSLQKRFPKERILLLRSEDFLNTELTTLAMAKLSAFTGLVVGGFSTALLGSKTNVQFQLVLRGAHNVVPRGEEPTGIYEISGFRPMLRKSRRVIYQRCRELCHALLSYEVEYPACVSVNLTVCEQSGVHQGTLGTDDHILQLGANMAKFNGVTHRLILAMVPFLVASVYFGFVVGRRCRHK